MTRRPPIARTGGGPAKRVRPFADRRDDSLVQVAFTLPVPTGTAGERSALELAKQMGLARPELVHVSGLIDGYTHFVVCGRCTFDVVFHTDSADRGPVPGRAEIERLAEGRFGRKLVVVGATTGSDAHSIGLDTMLSVKGWQGRPGLSAYRCFDVHNMGAQVTNEALLARGLHVGADALLVSQTVTQRNLHERNLCELVHLVDELQQARRPILVCGGARVTNDCARRTGFDAGFSRGTMPSELAAFLVQAIPRDADRAPRASLSRERA